jgi:hypothetical protein
MPNQDAFIVEMTTKLNVMWDKIDSLKHSDPFAAQCLYEKYKKLADELAEIPPSHSHIVDDQAVS